jgi:hypothetical protein
MAYYTRPEEVLEGLIELCNMAAPLLGIKYVATQEERLIPEYPCIQVASEPLLREIHGTYTFEHTFVMVFWVYHANLQVSLAKRSIEDMRLATSVVQFLHRPDVRCLRDGAAAIGPYVEGEDRIIHSYVSLETPGMVAVGEGNAIVTTRLLWLGTAQERFEHG